MDGAKENPAPGVGAGDGICALANAAMLDTTAITTTAVLITLLDAITRIGLDSLVCRR
jgi:hypothetical protein